MRNFAFLIAAGTLFALPLPASAAGPMTDVSAQVRIDAGPVGVRVGHDRWDSRRRNRRERVIIRDRDRGPSCRTVTVRERLPGGGVKIIKRKSC
jgi:hypothetical protein